MSKLNYPVEGIYGISKGHIENCANNISDASSNCWFDVPGDFQYRDYLNGLGDTLRNYSREINSIGAKIQSTDRGLSRLSDNLSVSAKRLTVAKVGNRERLVK